VRHGAGAYSDSRGIDAARESVKAYIEERDGFPTNLDDIYLTNGASEGPSARILKLCSSLCSPELWPRREAARQL
jgi:aspartate/methionine/tyrosine aminotransferase